MARCVCPKQAQTSDCKTDEYKVLPISLRIDLHDFPREQERGQPWRTRGKHGPVKVDLPRIALSMNARDSSTKRHRMIRLTRHCPPGTHFSSDASTDCDEGEDAGRPSGTGHGAGTGLQREAEIITGRERSSFIEIM